MHMGILLWVRRVAAVLISLVAAGAAFTAGLVTPYFLAAWTANILPLAISAVAAFALLAYGGTILALYCWRPDSKGLTAALSGLLTIFFFGWV